MTARRRLIAVIGNGKASPDAERCAEELGRLIVEQGHRLVTGGLGGVMAAASRGAHGARNYREGDVLGVLPSGDRTAANPHVDIVVPTNMGYARNVLIVSMADAVIAVGGGAGTLTEMAMAWQLGRIVIGLELDGWSGKLAGQPIDGQRSGVVIAARDPVDAVEKLQAALQA
jgi:uncharacterized protein (TIGR00725 family)